MKEGFKGQRQVLLPQTATDLFRQDKRLSLLHVTALGYYPKAKYHKIYRFHGAEQYILIYCVDGAGWFDLDGRRHDVHANEVFILPSNRPHSYGADTDNPWTIYWIHFNGMVAEEYAKGLQETHPVSPGIQSRIKERNELFEEIYSTLEQSFELSHLQYSSALLHVYLDSFQNLKAYRSATSTEGSKNLPSNITDSLVHYMEENIGRRMTKKDFAQFCGYSISQMSFLFKQQTGFAPMVYFNMLRIKKACSLLKSTDYQIGQICFMVGFTDQLYFSRVFTQNMGMTPTEYRQSSI